jgi:TonB family protein
MDPAMTIIRYFLIFFFITIVVCQFSCHPESKDGSVIVQPVLLSTQESLRYPLEAFDQGLQGKVVIRIFVNKEGKVSDTKILYSSGSDILDEAALKMARSSIFKPGLIDGEPSDFWLNLPIQFKLDGDSEISIDLDVWTASTLDYRKKIETGSEVNKSDTYKSLYYHYQSLANKISSSRSRTANKRLLITVEGPIGKPWLNYQDKWPLGFLLYQDYIIRYPKSEFVLKAHNDLIRYLEEEIEILERKSYTKAPYTSIYMLISETLKKLYNEDLF